jgi:hypothetical protein
MSAILYPVAANAESALSAPVGRAARESQAREVAGAEVQFVCEPAGPAFETYEAAAKAFSGRIDDGRAPIQPQDRYCTLREVAAAVPHRRTGKARSAKPTFKDGRRWPAPPPPPPTLWRLEVSYWRCVGAEEMASLEQARMARKKSTRELDAATLRALARQPLQPVRPQQPLDIGLFEFRPPDAPHILIPDE